MLLSRLTEEEIAIRLDEAASSICTPEAPHSDFPLELLQRGGEAPRPAAVLIPLFKFEEKWHLLFTRRTDSLPDHSGQVAFPGGRMDPEDATPEETALREAEEEIGLDPAWVRLLGRIDSFITITNYCVTPVVGIIPWPIQMRPAQAEVSRVFTIPLAWLADENNVEIIQRVLPEPFTPVPVIYFKKYDGEILWGVSAQITLNLLKILRGVAA
jgi:8-oxo-dGTP pyrophosphatase MutT (NUDIX family)